MVNPTKISNYWRNSNVTALHLPVIILIRLQGMAQILTYIHGHSLI